MKDSELKGRNHAPTVLCSLLLMNVAVICDFCDNCTHIRTYILSKKIQYIILKINYGRAVA